MAFFTYDCKKVKKKIKMSKETFSKFILKMVLLFRIHPINNLFWNETSVFQSRRKNAVNIVVYEQITIDFASVFKALLIHDFCSK